MSSNMAAEAGMDSCPSPEISDSRKRPLDGDTENGTTKRSNFGGCGDGSFHLKILVPSTAAGAIIGKGGDTIAQLQKDTGAKIKMSKSNDYYPGTSERICLITANVESIMKVIRFIMGKIIDRPDPPYDRCAAAEDIQLKILVPNSTAGMIIGKGGNYITQIKDESGAYVQLSQKAKDQILPERCITVIGDIACCEKACEMILAKIVEDPLSGSCLCVSYAHVTGPVANNSPTGSPFANFGGHRTPSGSFGSTASLNSGGSGMLLNGGGNSLNLSLNLGNPAGGLASSTLTAHLLDHIKVILRGSGYSDQATAEITAAMRTLAQYGILGMGLGLTGNGNGHPLGNRGMHSNGIGNSNVFGPLGTVSGGSSLDSYKKDTDEEKKTDMEIAENIVGAILGPGGRSLVEIQHLSGANIQISKKGIYAPGTNNRIVSIVGSPNAIATAQYLIEQRISEEEAKRARQTSLGLMQ